MQVILAGEAFAHFEHEVRACTGGRPLVAPFRYFRKARRAHQDPFNIIRSSCVYSASANFSLRVCVNPAS